MFHAVPWLCDQMQLLLPALAHQSTVMRLDAEPALGAVRLALAELRGGAQAAGLPAQPHMNVRVFRTAEEAAHAAAAAVAAQLTRKPASVLGLPTGRTSLAVYDELARLHESGDADFSRAHTFNLDEFVGLPSNDKRSYCAFMQKHLFTRINLPGSHVHFLNGGARDHDEECDEVRARDRRARRHRPAAARHRRQRAHRLQRAGARAACRAATGRGSRLPRGGRTHRSSAAGSIAFRAKR